VSARCAYDGIAELQKESRAGSRGPILDFRFWIEPMLGLALEA